MLLQTRSPAPKDVQHIEGYQMNLGREALAAPQMHRHICGQGKEKSKLMQQLLACKVVKKVSACAALEYSRRACSPMRGSLASFRISCLSSSLSLKAAKRSSWRLTKLASITVVKTGKPFLTLSDAS